MITHEPSVAAYAQRTIHVRDGKIEKEEKNKNEKKG
jgi:ABC-type lipoprotein export system ATPase subunit